MDDGERKQDDAGRRAREAAAQAQQRAREAVRRLRGRAERPRQSAGALFGALKETAGEMWQAARAGSAEAEDEMWARYERLTKHRRDKSKTE